MLGAMISVYRAIRDSYYSKECAELAEIRQQELKAFSDFSGITNIQESIDAWNAYVSRGRVNYATLPEKLALCNLATNIVDQFSRVDLYAAMKTFLPKSARLLDYGCGSAALTMCFRGILDAGYFLDVPNAAQDFIRYKIGQDRQLRALTPEEINAIEDKSLDVVLLWDVLEHLNSPSDVMMAVDAKLCPGGLLIWRAPWGNTLLGRHPDHNLTARKNFAESKEIQKRYKKVRSISALDLFYGQGVWRKEA